jgi:hypothetical protein
MGGPEDVRRRAPPVPPLLLVGAAANMKVEGVSTGMAPKPVGGRDWPVGSGGAQPLALL